MKELIKKSLSPAQISDVKIDVNTREATCYVLGEEKVKAIGK
jgi:transcription antitermination factor NusA-like protein